jgi:tetratricopeptide (TPR) repeat protein
LVVEFLRVWYDPVGIESRLQSLPANAELERRYFLAALQARRPDIPSPVEAALDRDLEAARATNDHEELVRVLVELAATAGSAWRCLAVAGEIYNLGRHTEALAAYDRAIALDPKYALAWNNKGNALYYLGRYAEALACYDRVIALDPKYALAWNGKGAALDDLGRYGEALAACDRAIALDPKNALAWINKGNALYDLGRQTEALACYDRVIELDPKYALAWINKGYALNDLGRHAEALAVCNQAIELAPKIPIESACSWENRGRAKLGLGQTGEAVEDFRHAIELNATHSGAFEGLAEAHTLQSNWTAAERTLCERFRLPPSPSNAVKSQHLCDLLVTIFRASTDRSVWAYRIGRLADIAREARTYWEQKKTQEKAKPSPSPAETTGTLAPPNPLAMLADSLVRSLTTRAYAEATADALDDWGDVWREVAERHPDLSLASRLFGVGIRYLRTKDELVLLDLLQEERSILRELFRLDEGAIQQSGGEDKQGENKGVGSVSDT